MVLVVKEVDLVHDGETGRRRKSSLHGEVVALYEVRERGKEEEEQAMRTRI